MTNIEAYCILWLASGAKYEKLNYDAAAEIAIARLLLNTPQVQVRTELREAIHRARRKLNAAFYPEEFVEPRQCLEADEREREGMTAKVAEFISENLTRLDRERPPAKVFIDDAEALLRLVAGEG